MFTGFTQVLPCFIIDEIVFNPKAEYVIFYFLWSRY